MTMQTGRTQTQWGTEHDTGHDSGARGRTDAAKGVASEAGNEARTVAGEAGDEARAVAHEAKNQAQHLFGEAKHRVMDQVDHELTSTVRSLGSQLSALADGRRDEAGQLADLVDQARERMMGFADRIEQRGPMSALDEVAGFARRRPGMFLLGAVGAGFAIGRMVRAGTDHERDEQGRYTGYERYGAIERPQYGSMYASERPITGTSMGAAATTMGPATGGLPDTTGTMGSGNRMDDVTAGNLAAAEGTSARGERMP